MRVGMTAAAFLGALAAASTVARGAISFAVSFDDPGGTYQAYHSEIASNVQAAGAQWARYLQGANTTLDIMVHFDDEATASASASDVMFVGYRDGLTTYEFNTENKILTGNDSNGAAPDADLYIGTGYLQSTMWFDPAPLTRNTAVPTWSVDAESVFVHEIGHMLAFNGWRDGVTGVPEDPDGNVVSYQSVFDQYVSAGGDGYLYYDGPHAMAVYGGPVPLTLGDYAHFGNAAPGPGSSLAGVETMNGVMSEYAARWSPTPLDLAVLQDVGYAVVLPEPATLGMVGLGVGAMVVMMRKRRVRIDN